MGQCECQTKQAGMSLLNIPLQNIQSDYPIQTGLFSYPQRLFYLKSTRPTSSSTYRHLHVQFNADFTDEIKLSIQTHSYLSEALRALTVDLQIKNVYLDELNISKILYSISKKDQLATLFIRNFYEFDQDYLNIAYEINTYLTISYLKCKQLHSIRQNFVVVPEQSAIDFYSHVALLQPVNSTLSLIIRQRRKHKKIWTNSEFLQLFHDLVEALSTLHENGLNHNDIRPSNVYYSTQKKCFMLGSFSNITRRTQDKQTKNLKEPNCFKPHQYKNLYSTRKISSLSSIQLASLDLVKSDVYSLGMTLLSAFYLCQSIDRKKCAPYNRSLINYFPYLAIIKDMTCKIDQRKSIFQIKCNLQKMIGRTDIKSSHVYSIQILDHSISGIGNKRDSYIAQGYKCLGMIGKWKDKLKEIFMREESIQSSAENAKKFEQLAVSSKIEGKRDKSMSEYAQAAQIYTNLGIKHFQEGLFRLAIDYFHHGLQNFEKVAQKENQESYLRLIVKITECKITSGHELIEESQLQYLQKNIQKMKSSDHIHYWEYMLSIYNICDYHEDYSKLDQLLTRNELSVEGIKTKIYILSLKMRIIRNNIKLATSSHIYSVALINKNIGIINEIFENYEYYLLQHPLQKLKMEFFLAKCYFLLTPHRTNLDILITLSSKLDQRLLHSSKQRQTESQPLYTQLYIQLFTEIGDNYLIHFKDHQEALMYYSKAFHRGKDFYGDIYNKHCAQLMQKIGRVNKSIDKNRTYLECNQLAAKIYRNIYGINHKAIIRINRRVKGDLQETINQTMCNSNHLQEASVN